MTAVEHHESGACTLDAFHRGNFWLVQPSSRGHRAGMDAMLLAAAVPSGFSGHLADLGAGAGAAGLAVASRCPGAHVTLVERSAEMVNCALRGLALPQNAPVSDRADVLLADVTLAGNERVAAGLFDRSYDFVIMNPPFNPHHDKTTPDMLRQEAHVMREGLIEDWMRTAAAIVKPRGGLVLIARPQSLGDILTALSGRFGGVEILPVHPRADAAAIRIVARARRGTRGGLSLCPPLVLHEGSGNPFTARADAINNGQESLFGD